MKKIRYLSLFTGIGGFELGLQQAYENNTQQQYISTQSKQKKRASRRLGPALERGKELRAADRPAPLCVGYSEIDRYATQIYQAHYPTHYNHGDITKIQEKKLPDFDLLVGGFPCQSFSIAGKRGGFSDTRGTLFFDICRLLKEKQPRLLLLENVKGLLSHDAGKTFATIVVALDELGYDIQWQVLNSKDFGVPQNRERIFIVGHLRGTPRPQVFPFGDDAEISARTHEPKKGRAQAEDSHTLRGSSVKADQVFVVDRSYPSRERIYTKNAPTVRNYGSGGNKMPLVGGVRRLTPVECERLQGFPDSWTAGISDTQRYKTLGNAVTVNVIQSICERLLR